MRWGTHAFAASSATPLALVLVAALVPGCAARDEPPDPDPGGPRAALALVEADNRTADTLVIAFRPAAGAGNEVVIGRAPPGERVLLAPVPAAEPIILSAHAAGRARILLPARSFVVDERWVWTIR